MQKIIYKKKKTRNKGFTLLIAIVVTSMLLIVSFVVVDIALKQIILSDAARESQYAFYNADSGVECAIYWDIPRDGSLSRFDPYQSQPTLSCNNNNNINPVDYSTGLWPPTISPTTGYATSTFTITLTKGCVVVNVTKKTGSATTTTINSRGYNSCGVPGARRYERGVSLTY